MFNYKNLKDGQPRDEKTRENWGGDYVHNVSSQNQSHLEARSLQLQMNRACPSPHEISNPTYLPVVTISSWSEFPHMP